MPASSDINGDVLQTVLEIKLQCFECGAIASAGSFPGTYPENGVPSVPVLVLTKRSHTAKPLPFTGSKSCYLYTSSTEGNNPTYNWFQLSFLTCKQVLVLSYTQSTAIPDVSHILSPHHLAGWKSGTWLGAGMWAAQGADIQQAYAEMWGKVSSLRKDGK